MSTDYRRKAKHLRRTSNAFLILAGLSAVLALVMLLNGFIPQGAITLGSVVIITLSGLSIRLSANQFARLARSQSRMHAWNRRTQ
jgi:uncharacterized membrane protein YczE